MVGGKWVFTGVPWPACRSDCACSYLKKKKTKHTKKSK